MLDNFAEVASIGMKFRRMFGRVNVTINTPLDAGEGRGRNIGDVIANIWDTSTLTNIFLEAPSFVPGGRHRTLPFWVDSVSTQFTHVLDPTA